MCKLGEEKAWAQTMMERFGVVLAHLRRVQDGTRWIQCTRSMGEPVIQLLKEMVDMIPPEDDFQNVKKPSSSTKRPHDDHSQGSAEPEGDTQEESHEGSSCGFSSGPTKYKPVSDSGDSAVEVPKVPTTKDKIKKQWAMKKPAASKTSAFSKKNSENHQEQDQEKRCQRECKLQIHWGYALQNDFGITSKLHPIPRTWATKVVFVGSL